METDSYTPDEFRDAFLGALRTQPGSNMFVQSIANQILLTDGSWGSLLSAAPNTLCSMGHCIVVASSPSTPAIKIKLRGDAEPEYLRTHLMRCSDLGRTAFRDAESKMNKLSMVIGYIVEPGGTVDKILNALKNERLAKRQLPRLLDQLEMSSDKCVKDAKSVADNFAAWQELAKDISLACTSTKDDSQVRQTHLTAKAVVAENNAVRLRHAMELAKEDVSEKRAEEDESKQRYFKAMDDFPTGLDGAIKTAVASIIEEGTGALLNAFNLITGRALYNQPRASTPITQRPTDSGSRISDALLSALDKLKTCLNDTTGSGTGPPGYGVDWDALDNPKSGIRVIFLTIKADIKHSGIASDAQGIASRALKLAKEIDDFYKDEYKIPATSTRDPDTVKRWRDTVGELLKEIAIEREKPRATAAQPAPQKSVYSATKGARAKLQVSRNDLDAAQELLQKSIERERKAQETFNEMQQKLIRLASEKLTIGEVIEVLRQCLSNLAELKAHLDSVRGFFIALHDSVDTIRNSHVKGFMEGVNDAQDEDDSETRDEIMEDILVDALKLKGHYIVAREVSLTYVEVSQKYIMPGVNTVDRLHVTGLSTDLTLSKAKEIEQYARKAASEVRELAEMRRNRLKQQLTITEGRIEEEACVDEDREVL